MADICKAVHNIYDFFDASFLISGPRQGALTAHADSGELTKLFPSRDVVQSVFLQRDEVWDVLFCRFADVSQSCF